MSLENHLSELERRREALDREISEEQLHPSVDDVRVAEMKRRKLLIRDKIEELKSGKTFH